MRYTLFLNPLIQDGAYYHLAFLLTQQSVARDSPFKIAQWTTQIMQKSRDFYIDREERLYLLYL